MATTELLQQMTAALADYGFTPAGQTVYHDEFGDGTGTVGWLRLRTEPRRSPQDDHDFLVVYSQAEGTWTLAAPGAEPSAIAATTGVDAAARALATAAARAGASEPAARMLPDWALTALGAAAVQVVVPFVQSVVGKSAEDAYAALRRRLSRRPTAVDEIPAQAPAQAPEATQYVCIADPDEDIQLIAPDPVPPAALRRLLHLDVAELRGRTFIWDESRQEWFPCRRSP